MELIWGGRVVATFNDLKNALVALGCPTGTDEVGEYVNAEGGLVDGQSILSGRYLPNTKYKIYAVVKRKLSTNVQNIYIQYTNASRQPIYRVAQTDETAICQAITDSSKTMGCLIGIYFSTNCILYDFYIQEYYTD